MALDNRYIPDISLSEFLIDPETGAPITGGTVEFRQDEDRSEPKPVFQLTGSPPNYTYDELPNPMDIVSGIPVNESGDNVAIYYFPYDELGNIQNYYVVVKNADGVVVNEREAWPNLTSSDDPTQTQQSVSNELDNSQFVEVLFNPDYGYTLTTGGVVTDMLYEIAPQWFLKVSSNADATILINRTSLEGSLNIVTNPPYQLEITPEGGNITSLQLIQRLNHNPDIWANGYISASIVATSLDGISHTIEGIYAPNVAASQITIFSETTGSTGYVEMNGTVQLLAGTNTDNSDIGYVDFIINLPVIGAVAVTSVQVVGLDSNQENVAYEQQTVNRQESLLFGYYNPLIQQVPVPSILQGWDFKVNPAQFGADVSMGAVASQYLWDQLIGWQSVNSLLRAYRGVPRQLALEHEAISGQIAIIQYISGPQLRTLLSNDFSVLIKAYTDRNGASGTVSFWVTEDATLPNVASGTNLSLISTIDANGKPATFHGNWTELARNYRGDGRFTIPYNGDALSQTISIDGWNRVENALNRDSTYGAIVIGFESYSEFHNVLIDSISVTPGLLARPVSPLSYELTLAELQYYYQKSYAPDVNPGTSTQDGSYLIWSIKTVIPDLSPATAYGTPFCVAYTFKRAIPQIRFYTVSGTADFIRYVIIEGSTVHAVGNVSVSNFSLAVGQSMLQMKPNNTSILLNTSPVAIDQRSQTYADFQITIDARLGIVL